MKRDGALTLVDGPWARGRRDWAASWVALMVLFRMQGEALLAEHGRLRCGIFEGPFGGAEVGGLDEEADDCGVGGGGREGIHAVVMEKEPSEVPLTGQEGVHEGGLAGRVTSIQVKALEFEKLLGEVLNGGGVVWILGTKMEQSLALLKTACHRHATFK